MNIERMKELEAKPFSELTDEEKAEYRRLMLELLEAKA